MGRQTFRDLRVFQLSETIADEVWSIVADWGFFEKDTVGKQLVRSADSIGANIAEGAGRGSYQDNRRFIIIARGSLQETLYWLRRAFRRELLKKADVDHLKTLLDELAPRLNSYLNAISKMRSPRKPLKPDSQGGA